MRDEQRNLMWTLMLLYLPGALCSQWGVDYKKHNICAVQGSSLVINCSFFYPDKQKVNEVMWAHERNNIYLGPFIFDSKVNNTSSRFQYIGDKQHNCSLVIHQVERNDTGKYAFRFITHVEKWTGKVGSTLHVIDLRVLMSRPHGNGTTKDGDSVNLTCVNGCDEGHLSSAFTWFKNRKPINEGAVLWLSNVTSADSGNYSCSLTAHTGTTSDVINIDVEYGPKNTLVSVRPSLEVDAGSSITLLCSSHAKPPVEGYTWFRIDDNEDITAVGQQPEFSTADGGRYLCSAANKHGSQNSSVVTLKIKVTLQQAGTFNKDVLIISVVAVLLIVICVVVVRRLKKRTRAPENSFEENTQNTEYVNWLANQSQQRSHCEEGTIELTYSTIDFKALGGELQPDPHHDGDSVVYSLVCG